MYTSMLLLALTGTPAADADGLAWQSDYSAAKKQAQTDKKPMAVFIGSGQDGYQKLSKDGKLGKVVEQILTNNYIPVYIDSTTPAGKKLAQDFELTSGSGLVLSDRGGEMMAFYNEGSLTRADMLRYLEKYADPNVVVRGTETYPGTARSSYYGPNGQPNGQGGYQSFYPNQGGYYPNFGGGGCANGRCGR